MSLKSSNDLALSALDNFSLPPAPISNAWSGSVIPIPTLPEESIRILSVAVVVGNGEVPKVKPTPVPELFSATA